MTVAMSSTRACAAGVTVMVVHDQRDGVDVLSTVFRSHGALVLRARSVDEALGVVTVLIMDLVMTDQNVGRESGGELLRAIRKRPGYARVPIFLMSAPVDACERASLERAGFAGVFSKPANPMEVVPQVLSRLH